MSSSPAASPGGFSVDCPSLSSSQSSLGAFAVETGSSSSAEPVRNTERTRRYASGESFRPDAGRLTSGRAIPRRASPATASALDSVADDDNGVYMPPAWEALRGLPPPNHPEEAARRAANRPQPQVNVAAEPGETDSATDDSNIPSTTSSFEEELFVIYLSDKALASHCDYTNGLIIGEPSTATQIDDNREQ
ncbi:hypothetical protein LMH87_010878 [Akanthomyces muscarius]|uniref:Uncharacterized protein n=1 Tax=Akanthomyces muscarius TaxID=2231603 RepID=A0A9W8QAN2_AKAMU|nr:hypothetical protein LMH87_010878 [Akanthomyces muscarius]KAJ4150113.1 hypothetical protein LMH87_010878 [Akanthomyces muscarius]